jgi:hypothetical protein
VKSSLIAFSSEFSFGAAPHHTQGRLFSTSKSPISINQAAMLQPSEKLTDKIIPEKINGSALPTHPTLL